MGSSTADLDAGAAGRILLRYLQLEGVCVVRTGGEVGVHEGAAAEGAVVRQLVLLAVLRLHALSVAVGGVGGAHRLTTYAKKPQRGE